MKNIEIIGGGTVSHVRNHLALCAPAYGTTARALYSLALDREKSSGYRAGMHLTKMADPIYSNLETNEDVSKLVDDLIADPNTKIIFFNVALVDFEGSVDYYQPNTIGNAYKQTHSGKYVERLKTSEGNKSLTIVPLPKLISKIRKERKDIFLVAFKTTCGATEDEQFLTGLHLLKVNSCNLVLANDTKTRVNMIITPEQARYHVSTNRDMVLKELVEMAIARSQGTFTRSTVIEGASVPWNDESVPASLRSVVNHCIAKGAYKPFNGATVGHFAVKVDKETFLTSKRKTDFNKLDEVGLVKIESSGVDSVIAHGARPSVGGMSQRIIFNEHPEMDSIVHFHVPPRAGTNLSTRPQKYNECGSMQCGKNTSDGLKEEVSGIKCVYLDNHGPNIVFNRSIDPQLVINFIDKNFDLSQSTDEIER